MNLWANGLEKNLRAYDPIYANTFKLFIGIRLYTEFVDLIVEIEALNLQNNCETPYSAIFENSS